MLEQTEQKLSDKSKLSKLTFTIEQFHLNHFKLGPFRDCIECFPKTILTQSLYEIDLSISPVDSRDHWLFSHEIDE